MNDPRTAGEQGLLRPFLAMTEVAPDTTATIGGIVTDQNKAVDKLRGDEEASWKKHMMEVLNSPEKNPFIKYKRPLCLSSYCRPFIAADNRF